jgi:hypothetical protein
MYHLNIEPDEIKNYSDEEQIEIMREWFHENFEDPVEECPYDSREGGYIFIWGGPYDAKEELNMEFGEYIDEKIINSLVDELESKCIEWSAYSYNQQFYDLEDEYLSIYNQNYETPSERFEKNIKTLKELALIGLDDKNKKTMLYMIYTHTITCLESFLSEFFIGKIFENEAYFQNFFENFHDFKDQKFSLNEIFAIYNDAKKIALKYLTEIVWHKIERISKLYKDVLDIEFPKDIGSIYRIVDTRHDIVHRCGKTKDGKDVLLSESDIQEVFNETSRLAKHINDYYSQQPPKVVA